MNKHLFKIILVFVLVTAVPILAQNADAQGNEPAVTLDKTVFEANGDNETLLHIKKPGRYSIQVKSKQGTRVTIVDRMAGPYKYAGTAGRKDGRIDLLLDTGTYKIRLKSHRNGSGKAELNVFPFKYVDPVPRVENLPFIPDLELLTGSLRDLQQKAFWIHIKKRQVLRLELLGRNLRDARLWRDGTWLEEVQPKMTTYEPVPGRPMTHAEFHHDMNPGLYLLTCYGGPAHQWTKETKEHPFYLRMGIPQLGINGQRLLEVSPFGRDTFFISGKTNFFQLVREEKKPAQLTVTPWGNTKSRYSTPWRSASITKKSRDPWCIIGGSAHSKGQWVTITAPPGDKLELDHFEQKYYHYLGKGEGRYWISSIHSAEGRDAVDVTAVLTHPTINTPVKAEVITITPNDAMIRRVNLLGQITVYLFIREEGTYVIDENPKAGAKGSYQLKPFMTSYPRGFKAPPFQDAATDFELTAGYYVLTVNPKSRGILHFALHKKANALSRTIKSIFSKTPGSLKKEPDPASWSLLWPEVKLKSQYRKVYTLYLNQRAGVDSGIICRSLPLDLREPLPVTLAPGKSVMIKVRHDKKMKVNVTGGKYSLKVDNTAHQDTPELSAGFHHLELVNNDSKTRLFNVKAETVIPYTPPPPPVLKKIEDIFPILTVKKPLFRNFDYEERKQFLLQVQSPALYRLETTGRMATSITVRTRTTTSLFNAGQNGIGRNALVQQYLKSGDYLINVQTMGRSKGRAGIFLRRTELEDITGLSDGAVKRCTLPADAAVRYRVEIEKPGYYHIQTNSLGKPLTHRLEDADGWPLIPPGQKGTINYYFPTGRYFYYSLPRPVTSRRVTSLRQILDKREISGKGPHILHLNESLENIWMEDDQRSPDMYRTEITAPIFAKLSVSDGMQVKVVSQKGEELAVTVKGKWEGHLPAGTHDLVVTAVDKNNRLPYTIHLMTGDLIPGLTQTVRGLPVKLRVCLAEDALVDITSFGDVDVAAILWNETEKTRIAAVDDIPHDWNFRISRNLKAGLYLLQIDKADTGTGSGNIDVRMQTRKELVTEAQTVPFSVKKTINADVLKIPFTTGQEETLLQVKVLEGKSGTPLNMALLRGDKLLAQGTGQIYIPLPGQKDYTLLAWADEQAVGETGIDAAALKLRDVQITGTGRTVPTRPAARLIDETGLSFRFKTPRGKAPAFYYSPLLERPCLPVTGAVESTANNRGWLVSAGKQKQVRLDTFEVRSGHGADVTLSDVPLAFSIHQQQEAPMLLEVKSVGALMGSAVFPANGVPGNVFIRSGMLAAPSLTLAGIPGGGRYVTHTWSTAPTPPVVSEKERFDTGERVGLILTPYPKEIQKDFRSVASVEAEVPSGESVWLQLKDEPQLLDMTLARGLVAFSWYKGRAVDMAAALDKNRQEKITVKGEVLYVVNTGEQPARFRAEKRGIPAAGSTVLHLETGFEKVFPTAGTLQIQLPEIPRGNKLFVAGSRIDTRLWGTDGKIYRGIPVKQPKNFDMESYQTNGGFLEIGYQPGLVKIWIAPETNTGGAFMGNIAAAEKAAFHAGMGSLKQRLQVWQFTMDNPGYISVETLTPTAMALVSGEKILYISTAAFRTGHQLSYYLSAGTYRLFTRPLPGIVGTAGSLTLKTITPVLLDEEKEISTQLIRPGEIQVFRFTVKEKGKVGVGLNTESDHLDAQLFDENSRLMGTGPLVLKKLPPGTYLLVVRTRDVPVQYRPVILGTKGSREGVPDDVVQKYKKEADQ
jgi:hypothetical protein